MIIKVCGAQYLIIKVCGAQYLTIKVCGDQYLIIKVCGAQFLTMTLSKYVEPIFTCIEVRLCFFDTVPRAVPWRLTHSVSGLNNIMTGK